MTTSFQSDFALHSSLVQVCICQCIGTVTCPLCVNAIMFTLLMVSSSAAALCRCISGRMLVGEARN